MTRGNVEIGSHNMMRRPKMSWIGGVETTLNCRGFQITDYEDATYIITNISSRCIMIRLKN